jgi:hypothetical protein
MNRKKSLKSSMGSEKISSFVGVRSSMEGEEGSQQMPRS